MVELSEEIVFCSVIAAWLNVSHRSGACLPGGPDTVLYKNFPLSSFTGLCIKPESCISM